VRAFVATRVDYEALLEEHGIDRYKINEDPLRMTVTIVVHPLFESEVDELQRFLNDPNNRPIGIRVVVRTGHFPDKGPYR